MGQSVGVRAAVIGHVEWVDFLRVDHMPARGEIVHATDAWSAPAGGGSVAAVQLAKLSSSCTFYTALGDDDLGRRAFDELTAMGVRVEAVFRPAPTRRAITHIEPGGERTITVLGDRLSPSAADPLPWDELAQTDAVYVTAGDPQGLRLARRARAIVATSRIILPTLHDAGVRLDGLVGSANDPSEVYVEGELDPSPDLVVRTDGERGGTYQSRGGELVRYQPAPVPGTVVDTYGSGDNFAAGLAYALGEGRSHADAVAFAARCGAASLTGAGPYEAQLTTERAKGD